MSSRPPVRVVAALAALSAVAVTTYGSRGSLGLFLRPWEEAYEASRAAVALTSAVGFIAVAVAQPLAGRLLATVPPRRLLIFGGGLAALGYAGAAWAGSLAATIVLVGGVAAFGAGIASLPLLSYASAELVSSREGTIFGVLTAAAAGGQVLVLPIATAALNVSLGAALMTLGVLVAVATVTVVALMPSLPPAPKADPVGRGGPPKALLADRHFWLLLVPFFICGYTTTGLTDTHLIPYAVDHHMSEVRASAALGTLAAFNVAGVLFAGWLTDRLDRGRMLAYTYAARAVVLAVLPLLTSSYGLIVFGALFGMVDFATVPPTTSLARGVYGPARWALVLGLVSAGHQAGSALGAWAGGALFDTTGSYALSFGTGAAMLLVAAALSWQLREGTSLATTRGVLAPA